MDWITVIEREGHALSTAARHDFKAAVPACPGWDVDDLLTHIARIHHRNARVIREGLTEPVPLPDAPSGNVLGWYEAGLADLLDAARGADPATPTWSPFGPVTVEFWLRRMAQETTVHRVDAEQATGTVGPVDGEVAVAGIDELVDVFLPLRHDGKPTGTGETVHLHATDAEGEWLLTLGDDGVAVARGHAKGDLALRGPVSHLLLWVWGRQPIEGLEVFGDTGLAARFRDLAAI